MNESTDIIKKEEAQTLCRKLKNLATLTAEADYDVTLRICGDSDNKSADCTHHMKGRSRHDLTELLAIGGLLAAAIAAVVCFTHVFCSLVCRSR